METSDPMVKKKSDRTPTNAPVVWKVLAIVFILISVALMIALIVVATKKSKSDREPAENSKGDHVIQVENCENGMDGLADPPKSSGLFDDLTIEEIIAVRAYLMEHLHDTVSSTVQE